MGDFIHPGSIRDGYGRRFDDLDAMRLRLAAQELVPKPGDGYSICSEDGLPMCGMRPNDGARPVHQFVAIGWSRA